MVSTPNFSTYLENQPAEHPCTYIPYRVLRGSGAGMIWEQEEDRADRELGEVDVPLDEADLLRHLGQLKVGVTLDSVETTPQI